MVYKYLVKTVLEKRGRTPFLSGAAFDRVVDSVTGADTDKIRGLVKGHPGDKYRWWQLLTDSVHHRQLLVHYPSLSCDLSTGMHMTKFHDDYVTERQDNIAKWNLMVLHLHAINGKQFVHIRFADIFVASCLSRWVPQSRRPYEEDPARPGLGADFHGRKPGGLDLRARGVQQGSRHQFHSGGGSREVRPALYRTPEGGGCNSGEPREIAELPDKNMQRWIGDVSLY
ncbi:unnamed protein product [Closterium sp. NIES-54]